MNEAVVLWRRSGNRYDPHTNNNNPPEINHATITSLY